MIAWEATASGYFTRTRRRGGTYLPGSKYALVLLSHTPTANGVSSCYFTVICPYIGSWLTAAQPT